MKRILVSFSSAFYVFLLSVCFVSEGYATPSVISFAGTERKLPRTASLYIGAVDIESGEVRDTVRTSPRSKVTIDCDTPYCLAALTGSGLKRVGKRSSFQEYFGLSKGFGGKLAAAKLRTLRITSRTTKLLQMRQSRIITGKASAGSGLRVGVPGNAFTISGTVAKENKPGAMASTVATTLVRSPCYRSGTDFSVIETDPRILAARKREFDLIKQGLSAPDPSFVDRYQPPNATVSGTVSSDGDVATASMSITNSSGQVIASSTVSVSNGGWFAAVDQAALDLGSQLCKGTRVAVLFSSCKLQPCSCCDREEDECKGFRIAAQLDGTAKLPVGGIVYTSLPSDSMVTQECGGTSSTQFAGAALACSRDTAEQNGTFNWKFSVLMPKSPSCSCPKSAAPENIALVATAIDLATGDRDDVVLSSLACTFSE